MENRKNLDISGLRTQLEAADGKAYWRSLDELAQTDEFVDMVHREFPEQAAELKDPVSRRNFLKLMSASLALGGFTACTIQPNEKIVPQVRAPENIIPGKPQYFASAFSLGGIGSGVLVESHMGRPTKLEGNGKLPTGSKGSTSHVQASILDLYDPDRSQTVKNAGRLSTWNTFTETLALQMATQGLKDGAGLRILTQTVTSPTLGNQLDSLRAQYPKAQWHQYESVNRDALRAGAVTAFGEVVNTVYDFSEAKVILSLDADFTNTGPASTRYARDFGSGRKVHDGQKIANRLYVVETSPSGTGSIADHRLALGTGHLESLTMQVAQGIGIRWAGGSTVSDTENNHDTWINAVVKDLKLHRGASLVIAGDQQSPDVHALAHAINQELGNVGSTVHYSAPLEIEPVDQVDSLTKLTASMQAGEVDALFIIGGNPVYDAPADINFAAALDKVAFRVHLGSYANETSKLCHWHIPESHYLEAWNDVRSADGTVSIVQPLIRPLYKSQSALELLSAINGQPGVPGLDIVKNYWEGQGIDAISWRRALHDGYVKNSALDKVQPSLKPLRLDAATGRMADEEDLEIHFRPDPMIWDGRFVNNAWLQETPKPITLLTWDNAALISPATAERLRLKREYLAELRFDGRAIRAAVWIVPGQADGVVTLHLGYGQQHSGRVGRDTGFNAYALRPSTALWSGVGLQVSGSYDEYRLACTQEHHSMEDRNLVRYATQESYQAEPDFAKGLHDPPDDLTLHNRTDHQYTGYAWGMVIDLGSCIGCNACTIACQAENNIPVVGKDEVLNGREMSWIRIDRYYKGEIDDPEIVHQPVSCMQCENAPCELVCPVAATVHSDEGLNDMVYNRCVGTRYCANNCPYKVRRFNFLQYADRDTESLKLQRNPNVTTRSRGVMEKCTYCVQRINQARIEAKIAGRKISDDDIQTACQQVCPTEGIAFGDINNPDSQVTKLKQSPLNYGILTELNTRPRTTYLAGIKNPNPEITEA